MTELTWDGKYDKDGRKVAPVRLPLPFQTIETVNESAQERQRALDFETEGRQGEWRNRLIWGDKKYVLPSLLKEFAGQVNLIYIDPPFDTGADFSFTTTIPESDESFTKEPSVIEQKAYRDTWGKGLDSYLQWFYETVVLLRELLADEGALYVHLDYHVGHYAKAVLDETFGSDGFRNELIWQKVRVSKAQSNQFGNVHDTLFLYSRSPAMTFNRMFLDYGDGYKKSHYGQVEEGTGRRYGLWDFTQSGQGEPRKFGRKTLAPPAGKHWIWSQERIDKGLAEDRIVFTSSGMPRLKRYLDEAQGNAIEDIWTDVYDVNAVAHERTGYNTQKPEALLSRIIRASSNEDDLVLDCFCGSGTTAAVAEKLGRRWIACDLGRFAIHTTRKRLLGIEGVRPFVVQNLGKYERQAWQKAEFDDPTDAATRERAYRKFILDLYHANPISGHTWLHGLKSGRFVHVGSVDAPVTVADVKQIVQEVRKAAGKDNAGKAAADAVGWDFAFEINDTMKQTAAEAGVDIKFKRIPREVLEQKAVEQGDIEFYELAALEVKVGQNKRNVTLELADFIMNPDDVPEDVQKGIKHWEQWVDYWAVDWDYRGDAFHNQWQSYRTRKDPSLQKRTTHKYEAAGEYVVVVKVIDILGNDTTKTLRLGVK